MVEPEIIIVPIVFAIPAAVLFARMWFRHRVRMATFAGGSDRGAALEQRLERIEQAVDTIALEMERMGEGQRFVTKLLSERTPPLPAPSDRGQAGRSEPG